MKKVKFSSIKDSTSILDADKMIALSNTGLILIDKKEVSNYISKRITMSAGESIDTGLIGKIFTLHNANNGSVAQYINGTTVAQLKIAFTADVNGFGVGSSATETVCAYKTGTNGSIWIKNNDTIQKAVIITIH